MWGGDLILIKFSTKNRLISNRSQQFFTWKLMIASLAELYIYSISI